MEEDLGKCSFFVFIDLDVENTLIMVLVEFVFLFIYLFIYWRSFYPPHTFLFYKGPKINN